jgi:hypothetical protein
MFGKRGVVIVEESFGVVLMIDISGYSALTSELVSLFFFEYMAGSVAKLVT